MKLGNVSPFLFRFPSVKQIPEYHYHLNKEFLDRNIAVVIHMLMFFNVISVAFEVRNLGCIQDVHVTCRSKSIIENVVDKSIILDICQSLSIDKFNLSIKVDNHKIFNWLSILSTKTADIFSIGHEIVNSFKVNPYGNKVDQSR